MQERLPLLDALELDAPRSYELGSTAECDHSVTTRSALLIRRALRGEKNPLFPAGFSMELGGLEPLTSWVRSRTSAVNQVPQCLDQSFRVRRIFQEVSERRNALGALGR